MPRPTHDQVESAHQDVVDVQARLAEARSSATDPAEIAELVELETATIAEYQRLRNEFDQPQLFDYYRPPWVEKDTGDEDE